MSRKDEVIIKLDNVLIKWQGRLYRPFVAPHLGLYVIWLEPVVSIEENEEDKHASKSDNVQGSR